MHSGSLFRANGYLQIISKGILSGPLRTTLATAGFSRCYSTAEIQFDLISSIPLVMESLHLFGMTVGMMADCSRITGALPFLFQDT